MSQQQATPAQAPAEGVGRRPRRNPELDLARGVALALAVVVLAAPNAGLLPSWLGLPEWHGLSVGALLPTVFATCAGVAIALQVRKHSKRSWAWWLGRLGRRAIVLVGLGLFVAWATGGMQIPIDLDQLQWTDDLVRIGVATVIAIPLVRLPRWGEVAIATALLVFHHVLLYSTGSDLSPGAHGLVGLDQLVLGAEHVAGSVDRNGVTALAPTLVAVLSGFWIGEWIDDRERSAATAGVLALLGVWSGVVAWSWGQVVPANATLWTGPVVAGGIALTLLLLAVGHVGTRWSRTDAMVASLGLGGRVTLPLWVVVALLVRWAFTTSGWRWFVEDGLGPLLTPSGAALAAGLLVAFGLGHLGGILVDRGLELRA